MAHYIAERSLQDQVFLPFLPSILAASSLFLARHILARRPHWPPDLEATSQYTTFTLFPCIDRLSRMLRDQHRTVLSSVRDKYSLDQYANVASLCTGDALNPLLLPPG